MDTLKSLRLFVEAVQIKSLSATGRKFGISPATVSRNIDGLEKQLGFQLLVRTSRQIGLTEAGMAYLPRVKKLLLEFDDATEFAKGFHSEAKGLLRVQARTAVGNICVAPLIPEFLEKYPEISILLSLTNETNSDLIKNNIDVDIRTGILQDSSLIARKLADSHRVIVSSPEYLKKHGTPQTPLDLEQHNCLTFRNNCLTFQNDLNSILWRFRDSDGNEIEIQPQGNLETDNGAVIRSSLLAGQGIGHMTDWSVAQYLREGTMVRILEDYEVTVDKFHHGIYAIFLPSRNQSRKVRAFIDFLVDAFKRENHLGAQIIDNSTEVILPSETRG